MNSATLEMKDCGMYRTSPDSSRIFWVRSPLNSSRYRSTEITVGLFGSPRTTLVLRSTAPNR